MITDWKKELEEAGFSYMHAVKEVRIETRRNGAEGWAEQYVVVWLALEKANVHRKVEVSLDRLNTVGSGVFYLCDLANAAVKSMLAEIEGKHT